MSKLISKIYLEGEYANQSVELPVVGVVTFDKNGHLTVPDDKVAEVIRLTKDAFNFYDSEKGPGEGQKKSSADEEEMRETIAGIKNASEELLLKMASEAPNPAAFLGLPNEMIRQGLIEIYKEHYLSNKKEQAKKKQRKKRGPNKKKKVETSVQ